MILAASWLPASLAAAGPAVGSGNGSRFEQLTNQDGLSQMSALAILQDHQGFLWIGTEDGLNRYDGTGFRVFKHDPLDPGSLSDDSIRVLHEDRGGRPPWWRTWWAYTAAFLAISGLLFAYSRHHRKMVARERRIARRERAISASLRDLAALKDELLVDRAEQLAEREKLIGQLQAKNEELTRFSYTVSHDLKNPLVTIKNFVGLIRRDAAAGDHERLERDLDRVEASATKMQLLIAELLELSRTGRVAHPPEDVAFDDLVREASEVVAGALAQRGVELQIAPDLPVVRGDRLRLLEVVQNLLDNAVKFMGRQEAPKIEIGVRSGGEGQEASAPTFYMRDNGSGIDPAYSGKVFELFERLEPAIDGTGVGLALVKRIVEVHGGRVWVESEGAGRGSTFCFTLPLVGAAQELEDGEPGVAQNAG